jgi:hypothetical protein
MRITASRAHRISPRTRRRTTWPPSLPIRALRRPQLPAPSKALRRPLRTAPTPRRRTRVRMIRGTESSRNTPLPSRHRHCPTTTSPLLPATATCGRPDTGPGVHTAITGCPARGWRLRMRGRSGRPATGATGITIMGFTPVTGASTSATMAASITALVTLALATRAATGAAATSTTTAPSII